MTKPLTEYFAELVELTWREYLAQERSPDVSSRQALLFALVRACVEGKLSAIQMSLDRLDGPVAKKVETILPKFYTVYPHAKSVASSVGEVKPTLTSPAEPTTPKQTPHNLTPSKPSTQTFKQEGDGLTLPSGKLRPVLDKMLDTSQSMPRTILEAVKACDKYDFTMGNPKVKSAMVAGLLRLAHNGKLTTIAEVFDQLDGKIADVYHLLGDDVYTVSYAEIAPAGAVKNEDGLYQLENQQMSSIWVPRLESDDRRIGR